MKERIKSKSGFFSILILTVFFLFFSSNPFVHLLSVRACCVFTLKTPFRIETMHLISSHQQQQQCYVRQFGLKICIVERLLNVDDDFRRIVAMVLCNENLIIHTLDTNLLFIAPSNCCRCLFLSGFYDV